MLVPLPHGGTWLKSVRICSQVAACLMGAALPQGACAARMLLFVGGPSTEGAGKVVDRELSEPIRSHEVGRHVLPALEGGVVCLFAGVQVVLSHRFKSDYLSGEVYINQGP